MTDNELINYYEKQEERMAREIMELKFVIQDLKKLNKALIEKLKKLEN